MSSDTKRDIEEGTQVYAPRGFHPVYIGDVFNDRYQVLNKIGYGVYSTVWLVRDLKPEQPGPEHEFRALKVLSAECYDSERRFFEREILTHFRTAGGALLGSRHVCQLLDDFEHHGPNGMHVCLVFELMGETLRTFGAWFPECEIPNYLMRRFTIQLLLALDCSHTLNIVHTDIKPDNIFVKFKDHSRIESYLKEVPIPQQDRSETQYTVVPSTPLRYYYFTEASEFDIALGDWGVASWTDRHLSSLIQPVVLRSPEVLIEAPWDTRTDFWNLGAVVLELFRAVRMFSGSAGRGGPYELKEHLREIVDLFGPFPRALLERGNQDLVRELFDDDGTIKDAPPMVRPALASNAFMPNLHPEVREEFASFLRTAMMIDPEERVSAEDLLRHPWLNALQ
ncbi:serine/threonine protein kinase [Aspergillus steynii IBT 23096]|uniref:non-specific serine/threonine protein kinase n=1 Tax=Aspergillus steynii IBT 23096 TaxID=1392250 RepID=A0A2I2G4D0_9EURO|nr:serine/threonine protein kinase [Aspergillus steynii IBT 23096]PLB47735.1 serine/threonine protein kinase [Aspergillus steynii IBT 23096]